jgi:hypothetical protein
MVRWGVLQHAIIDAGTDRQANERTNGLNERTNEQAGQTDEQDEDERTEP